MTKITKYILAGLVALTMSAVASAEWLNVDKIELQIVADKELVETIYKLCEKHHNEKWIIHQYKTVICAENTINKIHTTHIRDVIKEALRND